MDTPNKTFSAGLTESHARGKITANQQRLTCPKCGFLLARLMPGGSASGLLLYCRNCKKQVAVNIPKAEP